MHSETPLEKDNFPFVNWYKLQIPSCLKVGSFVYSHLSVLGCHLAWYCSFLCRLPTASVRSYIFQSLLSGRHSSLGAIHHFWILKYFCLLFYIDTCPDRRYLVMTSHLGLNALKSFVFCIYLVVGLFVASIILPEEAFLMIATELSGTMSCGYSRMS